MIEVEDHRWQRRPLRLANGTGIPIGTREESLLPLMNRVEQQQPAREELHNRDRLGEHAVNGAERPVDKAATFVNVAAEPEAQAHAQHDAASASL